VSDGPPRRRTGRRLGAAFLCALAGAGVHAEAVENGRQDVPALVIVAGVGGTPEHRERFSGWARDLCAAALATPAPGPVRVLVERLPEDGEPADPCAPVPGAPRRNSPVKSRRRAGRRPPGRG